MRGSGACLRQADRMGPGSLRGDAKVARYHGDKVPPLDWPLAIWNAFLGRSIEHFPRRLNASNEEETLESDQILKEIGDELSALTSGRDVKHLENLLARGRETLDEVKALTEYEDQKAVRLLTVVSFFTALAGVLFNSFSEAHAFPPLWGGPFSMAATWVVIVYVLFGLFVLGVIFGALVIFHANQVRFKYPKRTNTTPHAQPKSRLFFSSIIGVEPKDWARSFVDTVGSATVPRRNLSVSYAKNYIAESYLVAAKVADKLRYLEPAQVILGLSLRILVVWLAVLAAGSIFVPAKDNYAKALDLGMQIRWEQNPPAGVGPTASEISGSANGVVTIRSGDAEAGSRAK